MKHHEQLGNCRIDEVLGEGGMGVVYKGWHLTLNQPMAIKTIRHSLLQGKMGRELRERFTLEAQAAARLRHPNIVRIHEFAEDASGDPFFVMDFVEGRTLKEFLSRGMHFDVDNAVDIVLQILSALAHSHERGVVHRDIKPANLLLQDDDAVMIMDFGIARVEESGITQTGRVMGTPQYFSPEQAKGQKTDGRSDLYSTALVLFELLTGERLMTSKPQAARPHKYAADKIGHLENCPDATRRRLKLILSRALAELPEKRYATAEEFSQQLLQLKDNPDKGVPASRPWWHYAAAAAVIAPLLTWGGVTAWTRFAGADQCTPEQPLTAERSSKVEKHLGIAQLHTDVGYLISPPGRTPSTPISSSWSWTLVTTVRWRAWSAWSN